MHAGVQHVSLLEGGSQRPMQTVFEIELAVPIHDVGKQVSIERGVRIEQRRQVERVFRRDELIEPDLVGRQLRPIGDGEAMLGVRTVIAHALEDHQSSLGEELPRLLLPATGSFCRNSRHRIKHVCSR